MRLALWMLCGSRSTPFGHPETLRGHRNGRTIGAVFRGPNDERDLMMQGELAVRRARSCAWAGRVSTLERPPPEVGLSVHH